MGKSYNQYQSWKLFQDYFPEEYRITDSNRPEEFYWNWNEYEVHIDHYLPRTSPKGVKLILVHGGGGNGRLLSPIGVALSLQGYECIAPDFPGFGLTVINKPNSYYTWIALLNDLVDKELEKNKKIVLCGISLGGMLSYQVACQNKNVDALMVSSLADTRRKNVQLQLAKNKIVGKYAFSFLSATKMITDNMKIPIKVTTKMWAMANNPSFVDKLKKDKVGSGSWVYMKFLRTLFEANPKIEPEDFSNCPLLFFQPENDHIIPWEISEHFYNKLNCDKKIVVLKGCGHIPMEKPGIDQLREAALNFLDNLNSK
tara:strand:- start:638 stop:1576 length:939 start_codon:yes stop_codon:yes gene_type:complete